MSHKEYKEMFDEIKVSDERLDEIEMAMKQATSVRRRPSMRKVVVLAACMAMLVPAGVMAGEAIVEVVKQYQIEHEDIEYVGIDKDVRDELQENGTIVNNELAEDKVKNKITADTKYIVAMVNGVPVEYNLDVSPYIREDGRVLIGTLRNDLSNSEEFSQYIDNYFKDNYDYTGFWSGNYEVDEEGYLIITILRDDDPRNWNGWCEYHVDDETGDVYVMVPDKAEFDEDVELTYFQGTGFDIDTNTEYTYKRGAIKYPELEEKEVEYYNFTYEGKRYAVGIWWEYEGEGQQGMGIGDEGKIHRSAVIELDEQQ